MSWTQVRLKERGLWSDYFSLAFPVISLNIEITYKYYSFGSNEDELLIQFFLLSLVIRKLTVAVIDSGTPDVVTEADDCPRVGIIRKKVTVQTCIDDNGAYVIRAHFNMSVGQLRQGRTRHSYQKKKLKLVINPGKKIFYENRVQNSQNNILPTHCGTTACHLALTKLQTRTIVRAPVENEPPF